MQPKTVVRTEAVIEILSFGVGTIIAVEALADDAKLTVRFATVGQKKLHAKHAKLTLA